MMRLVGIKLAVYDPSTGRLEVLINAQLSVRVPNRLSVLQKKFEELPAFSEWIGAVFDLLALVVGNMDISVELFVAVAGHHAGNLDIAVENPVPPLRLMLPSSPSDGTLCPPALNLKLDGPLNVDEKSHVNRAMIRAIQRPFRHSITT